MFSFTPFDFTIGVQGDYNPPFDNCEKEKVAMKGKQDLFSEDLAQQIGHSMELMEAPSQCCQQLGALFEFFPRPQPQPIQKTTNFLTSQTGSDHQEPGNEISPPLPYSLSSLELLMNYGSGVEKLTGKQFGKC
ncbi:putative DELLA protein RGL2 [Tripterygium wilfordii]|uniref:Putative DELLA protein RGL2 n=1 Tax=Tripterygium wilfordii TaxID=458696 RepID=A0A7J7DHU3_TRIWF|nr:putative DELLA protein RGL2 [Tripterygium wilfordii]